jgi:hypothetical protein
MRCLAPSIVFFPGSESRLPGSFCQEGSHLSILARGETKRSLPCRTVCAPGTIGFLDEALRTGRCSTLSGITFSRGVTETGQGPTAVDGRRSFFRGVK